MAKKVEKNDKDLKKVDVLLEGANQESANTSESIASTAPDASGTAAPDKQTATDPTDIQTGKSESEAPAESTGLDCQTETAGNRTEGTKTVDSQVIGLKITSEKRAKIAGEVFAQNAQKTKLFFTADMVPFFDRSDAQKHANTLNDKNVVTVNKE